MERRRALERALAPGDVACVLAEPALTNIGIVLPEPGFHDSLRELTRRTGRCRSSTRRTPSAPARGLHRSLGSGARRAHDRKGDRRWSSRGRLRRLRRGRGTDRGRDDADYEDVGGIGGTLAGNALSLAAVRATLADVLTEEAFGRMIPLAARFAAGVADVIEEPGFPGT